LKENSEEKSKKNKAQNDLELMHAFHEDLGYESLEAFKKALAPKARKRAKEKGLTKITATGPKEIKEKRLTVRQALITLR